MMKPRADKFEYAANKEEIMTIQGEVQRHKSLFEDRKNIIEMEQANRVFYVYTPVAFDEGYRSFVKGLLESLDSITPHSKKLKRHKKGFTEYSTIEEVERLMPLIKKRINSKRLQKAQMQLCKEEGRRFKEEMFVLMVCIHTGFEHGVIKAKRIEEMAKWLSEDQGKANLLVGLFLNKGL